MPRRKYWKKSKAHQTLEDTKTLSSEMGERLEKMAQNKSKQKIREEEELQLALALSQSEEESKAKQRDKMRGTYNLYGGSKDVRSSSPQPFTAQQNNVTVSATMMDPELARYLYRNYWQQKSEDIKSNPTVTQPSAPIAVAEAKVSMNNPKLQERDKMRGTYNLYSGSKDVRSSSPQPITAQQNSVTVSAPMIDTTDMDTEPARYLNRNYWQQKSEDIKSNPTVTQPSVPIEVDAPKVSKNNPKVLENGETDEDPEQFLNALNSSVKIFVNRMRSNCQRGLSIATDSSVQSLFNVISNMHPQLMKYVQGQEDLRAHYKSLQNKLAQLRDAREALNALREDHREKRWREMEEIERQRQIQMAQKLDIMRQKKHEYLEMQRQLALQRLQKKEREMQMRFEQKRLLTQMRQMQNYGYNQPPYPQGPMPGAPGGFNLATGQMEGSPVHQLHQQAPGQYMGNQLMYGAPPTSQGQSGQPPYPQGPLSGAPGGFNPATGQMEGSPVHQLHQQAPGQYMGNQLMYGAPPTSQGQYGQVPSQLVNSLSATCPET